MMLFTDNSRGIDCAKDPAVVAWAGEYRMYYSIPPAAGEAQHQGWGIGVARSRDLDHWERIGSLEFDLPCCSRGFCAPGAIVHRNAIHLFFQSYGRGSSDAICHAVSRDGLHFIPDPEPVFSPTGDWNCGRAIDADVILWKNRLLLFCATRDPEMQKQLLVLASAPAESDFSRGTFTQISQAPLLSPELPWEQQCIEAPAACIHHDKIYLFYAGAYNNSPQQIGCAVSGDGEHWQRISDQPLLSNGSAGSWNHAESGHPFVFTDENGRQHLFYQGNPDGGKTWYLSRREIVWNGDVPQLATPSQS